MLIRFMRRFEARHAQLFSYIPSAIGIWPARALHDVVEERKFLAGK